MWMIWVKSDVNDTGVKSDVDDRGKRRRTRNNARMTRQDSSATKTCEEIGGELLSTCAVFLLSTNLLSHMACRKYDKPWKYDLETQRNTNDNILEIQLVGVGLIKGIGAAVFLLSSNLLSCSPLPLLGEV